MDGTISPYIYMHKPDMPMYTFEIIKGTNIQDIIDFKESIKKIDL
jgi:hypothetical protein